MKSTCFLHGAYVFWVTKLLIVTLSSAVDDDISNLPVCSQAFDLDHSGVVLLNSSCVHQLCSETEATLLIPMKLLDGYLGHAYKASLVTSDGCFVREAKDEKGSYNIISVKVPFNGCGTRVEKIEQGLRYYNSVYISYIGTDWRLYMMAVSCVVRLSISTTDWSVVPRVGGCQSGWRYFVFPRVSNLTVDVDFFQQELRIFQENERVIMTHSNGGFEMFTFPRTVPKSSYRLKADSEYEPAKHEIRSVVGGRTIGVQTLSAMSVVARVSTNDRRASFSVLPICALGLEYVVVSYPSRDSHVIVSSLNIWRDYSADVRVFDPDGVLVSNITLPTLTNTVIPNATTGYRISSDAPVAVFSVMLDAKVPYYSSNVTIDHMAEQLPPVTVWGSEYVVHPIMEGHPGFYLILVAAKRTVRLSYTGISESGLPASVTPYSYEVIDVCSGWPAFIVRSDDGTNFMASIVGKSGSLHDAGTKAYPFMLVLRPTRSYVPSSNVGGDIRARDTVVSLGAALTSVSGMKYGTVESTEESPRIKPEVHYMSDSVTIPGTYWENVSCSGNLTCSDPDFAYFLYQLPVGKSSSFYSRSQVFETTVFSTNFSGSGGSTAYSGPARFSHQLPQDDYCDIGWTLYKPTQECLSFFRGPVRWEQAKEYCNVSENGSSLVTFYGSDKERFVMELASLWRTIKFKSIHIGLRMNESGEMAWVDTGATFPNSSSLAKSGDEEAVVRCGIMQFEYSIMAPSYRVAPSYRMMKSSCSLETGFVCQKTVELPAITTIPVPETTVGNSCLNGGTYFYSGVGTSACKCPGNYAGPYCGEYKLPESGVYAVTARNISSLNSLLRISRQKRSYGELPRWPSVLKKLVFEIHEFGGMRAFRLLTGCPQPPLCHGWLAWAQYYQVVITNAKYGPHLLQMFPDAGGYVISFDMGRRVVSSDKRYFFLADLGQNNVVFQLEKLHGIGEFQDPPAYNLRMRRFELNSHSEALREPTLALPLSRDYCPAPTSEFTVCTWFRSFRGPGFSPVIPLVFYNITKPDLVEWLNASDPMIDPEWLNASDPMIDLEVFRLQPVLMANETMKIDIAVQNVTIASTKVFQVPPVGYRHHLCFREDKITLDGVSLPLRFLPDTKQILKQKVSFVTNGDYLGQIDGMDAWCGKKTDEFLFRESGILPECGSRRGDLASAQSGDLILSDGVEEKVVLTPETACQFCPPDWVLHRGSCYHADLNAKSAHPSEVHPDLAGARCKPTKSVVNPMPAMMQLPTAPPFVAKYVDVLFGYQSGTAWFGLYRDRAAVWKWTDDPASYVVSTYWGSGEPRAFDSMPVCAMYRPFLSDNEWIPMPATAHTTLQSPNGYHWSAEFCRSKMALVCQQPSTVLDAGRCTMLRVFLFGGSYVSRTSLPRELEAMRMTLTTIVDSIALEASGQVVYELIRIRATPVRYFRTKDVNRMRKRISRWRPLPGEPNLGKVVEYINLHSKDDRYRYVNIVTSAYAQQLGPDETDSKSTTFALGILWTHADPLEAFKDHLRAIATRPSCIELDSADPHVGRRVVNCVRGIHAVGCGVRMCHEERNE